MVIMKQKTQKMEAYLEVVKDLARNFRKFELIRIPRGENTTADALVALASTSDPEVKRIIPVECISERSIKDEKETFVVTRSRAATRDRGEPAVELPPVKRRKSKEATVPKLTVEEDIGLEPIEEITPDATVEAETEPWVEENILAPYEHPEPKARVFYEIDQIPAKDWGGLIGRSQFSITSLLASSQRTDGKLGK